MTKVAIIGGKADQQAIITSMHKARAVHVEEHSPDEIDIGSPMESSDEVSQALVKATSLLSFWGLEEDETVRMKESNGKTARTVNKIHAELQREDEKLQEARERMRELRADLEIADALDALGIKRESLQLKSVTILAGTVKQPKGLREALDQVTTKYALSEYDNDKAYVGVAVDAEHASEMRQALGTLGFEEFDLQHVRDNPKTLKKELKDVIAVKQKHERSIADLKAKHGTYVQKAAGRLREDAEISQAPLMFASTQNLFYATGYVPSQDLIILKQMLDKAASKRVHVEVLEETDKKNMPVKLNHPKPVKDFQFFMDLYNLPLYTEFDPTFFTFLTFPLLYGFMLGDVGYGITALALFWTLKKLIPAARGFMNILMTAAVWTIFWGFMFGEVFGYEVLWGYDLPRILSRLHEINSLLILSVAVGVIHLNIGLAIGFVNELKSHGWKAAILEKFSWVVLQAAAVLFYLSYGIPIFQLWVPYVALAIALVMLYLGEGVQGLIEFPSIFSNMLSYARLMAIGLASAGLAVVVNQFTSDFIARGVWGIIPAVLIFAIGHIINLGLGTLGPFLHSLRLHYVEFFSRFFKGGGRKFEAFGGNN